MGRAWPNTAHGARPSFGSDFRPPEATFWGSQVLLEDVALSADPPGARLAASDLPPRGVGPTAASAWRDPGPLSDNPPGPAADRCEHVGDIHPGPAAVAEPVGFETYVRQRSLALLRLAYLLTGDHHGAKDLVQTTLTKVFPRWDTTAARGDPHAYVRAVMVHTAISWRRRKWQAERATTDVPDRPGERDLAIAIDHRQRLRLALLCLPPRQRAAVVLRHYEDLSEAQTAAALGCSLGTVKSQTAKALDRLRTILTDD